MYDPNPETTDITARAAGKCGWIKKDRQPCKNKAGHGTTHTGKGCCSKHGGAGGRKVTTGLYARIERPRIKELLAAAAALDDPLDMLPHVLMLQALVVDWVDRYATFTDALIAWHESYKNPERVSKPLQIMDITAAAALIDKCGAMIERIHKQEERKSVPLETFELAMQLYAERVAGEVREVIDDAHLRAELGRALNGKCKGMLDELLGDRKRSGS